MIRTIKFRDQTSNIYGGRELNRSMMSPRQNQKRARFKWLRRTRYNKPRCSLIMGAHSYYDVSRNRSSRTPRSYTGANAAKGFEQTPSAVRSSDHLAPTKRPAFFSQL